MELSPLVTLSWSLWPKYLPIDNLLDTQRLLCFGAKWLGKKGKYTFKSEYHHSRKEMLETLHKLYDEADIIVGWNSQRFDDRHVRRDFLEAGMEPPSPVRHIDLMKIAKREFFFPSNKLDYVADKLLGERKKDAGGIKTWKDILFGTDEEKKKAWNKMRTYQKQDVLLLEPLYEKMVPWATSVSMPNVADGQACNRCGSDNYHKRGLAHTNSYAYQRFQCLDCKTWFRGRNMLYSKTVS